jgi:hypothetical protein
MSNENAVNENITNLNTNPEPESSILTDLINKSKDTEDGTVVVKRSVVIVEHTTLSTDDLMKLKGQYKNSCSKYMYQDEDAWMKTRFLGLNASDIYGFDGDNHYVDTLSFHLEEDLHRWENPVVEF